MMNKIFILLACLIGICLDEEGIKHPWYMEFRGNNVFSNFQIEEQIDIPDEFGQLDTTKQDFLMRLSIENLKALYYSRGYFSLEMNLDIRREHISQDSVQRGYVIFINEGERYRFGGTKVIAPDTIAIEIKTTSLETSNSQTKKFAKFFSKTSDSMTE